MEFSQRQKLAVSRNRVGMFYLVCVCVCVCFSAECMQTCIIALLRSGKSLLPSLFFPMTYLSFFLIPFFRREKEIPFLIFNLCFHILAPSFRLSPSPPVPVPNWSLLSASDAGGSGARVAFSSPLPPFFPQQGVSRGAGNTGFIAHHYFAKGAELGGSCRAMLGLGSRRDWSSALLCFGCWNGRMVGF